MKKELWLLLAASSCLLSTRAGATDSDLIHTFEKDGKISFLVSENGAPAVTPADIALPAPAGAPHECKGYYPSLAMRWLQKGTMLVSMRIGTDGRVENIGVAKSSGYSRLNEAGLDCVRNWVYSPARRNGQPVAALHTVEIVWRFSDPAPDGVFSHP